MEKILTDFTVAMAANGRIVVPAEVRSALGMRNGGRLVLSVTDGRIVLEPYRALVERQQAEVRRYVPEGMDLAEELSVDRRREAALE